MGTGGDKPIGNKVNGISGSRQGIWEGRRRGVVVGGNWQELKTGDIM